MERLRQPRTLEKICDKNVSEKTKDYFAKIIDSPIGKITLLADDDALVSIGWGKFSESQHFKNHILKNNHSILQATEKQLKDYFKGQLKKFDLPLAPAGTDFQKAVWKELTKIPYGKTISYGLQAARVGNPKASRAVGAANGKNPIGIIIPCHRVIGASGTLTGYAGGLEVKKYLLELEAKYAN